MFIKRGDCCVLIEFKGNFSSLIGNSLVITATIIYGDTLYHLIQLFDTLL